MARMVIEHLETQPAARIARYRRISIVDLSAENLATAKESSGYLELWRDCDQIGITADLELTFASEADNERRRVSRHCDRLVQRHADLRDHCPNEIDHATGAARERRLIRQ